MFDTPFSSLKLSGLGSKVKAGIDEHGNSQKEDVENVPHGSIVEGGGRHPMCRSGNRCDGRDVFNDGNHPTQEQRERTIRTEKE